MKRNWIPIGCLLLTVLTMLSAFSSCKNEDDVIEVLTGKTWKMSRLTTEGSSSQFAVKWASESDYNTSMSYLTLSGYYTVSFNGVQINGELSGNQVSVRGCNSSASGTWTANGKSKEMSLSLSLAGDTETDSLAVAFMEGIQKVYKYSGDENQLNLYFMDGSTSYVIGFTKQ